jgi:hypothetical protein
MTRRPIAQVRVLKQPHLHPEAVRVEVDCRHATAGITQMPAPGGLELPTPALVTAACFEHEARCSQCDTAEAHRQGNVQLREWTEEAWSQFQAARGRRYAYGRWN